MNRTAMVALATILLSGCAASVVSSTPRTVMIQAGTAQGAEAMQLAEKECAKHGLHARLAGTQLYSPQFIFDCVP